MKVDGKYLAADRRWHPRIGYVSQVPYLIGNSIQEMVTGKSSLSPDEDISYQKCLLSASLEELSKRKDFRVTNEGLSGGQRKQIALARALFTNPQILILDEVAAGMDQPLAISILKQLKNLESLDVLIMTTHEDHFDSFFNVTIELRRTSRSDSKRT